MYRVVAEYKIAVGAAASVGREIAVPTDSGLVQRADIQYRLRAKGCDVVFKFGDASVAASAAVVDDKRPDGNCSIAEGAIEMFKAKSGQSHVSVVAEDGASTGVLILTVGVGEV